MDREHGNEAESIQNLLFFKMFGLSNLRGYSWADWRKMRKFNKKPIYESKILECKRKLTASLNPKKTTVSKGAYLSPLLLYNDLVTYHETFSSFGELPFSPGQWTWKISTDGLKMQSQKVQAVWLLPLNVIQSQNSLFTARLGMAQMVENNMNLNRLFEEMQLNEFITVMKDRSTTYQNIDGRIDFIFSADWISLVSELGCDLPNARKLTAQPVPWCKITKKELKHEWYKTPYRFYRVDRSIEDFPTAALLALPLKSRRYDWMHLLGNMLSNVLDFVCDHFTNTKHPKYKLKELIEKKIFVKWKRGKRFSPKSTKFFWAKEVDRSIVDLLSKFSVNRYSFKLPDGSFTSYSTRALLDLVFSSLRCYYKFAYLKRPSPSQFHSLLLARQSLCMVLAHFRCPLAPTLFYALNHAVEFAVLDGTAYFTLQEGVEHANRDLKRSAEITLGPAMDNLQTGENCYQELLRIDSLRRTLAALGIGLDVAPEIAPLTFDSQFFAISMINLDISNAPSSPAFLSTLPDFIRSKAGVP